MAKIVFLFSGQGAQAPGMMKDIAESSEKAKAVFDQADVVLGRDITGLTFEGTQEELNLTHNTQPCMIAAELAAYAALTENGIRPDAVAGFSLGEYSALVAAGVLSREDALKVIQIRADAMQDAVPVGQGAMAAVTKQDAETVQALCDEVEGYVIPVNYNCPGQIVVSGENDAVDRLIELAKSRKIRTVKLAVSAPFHCAMMNPASEKLAEAFRTISFGKPEIPCYSNVDAKPYGENTDVAAQLCLQAKSPVLWEQTLRNLAADGFDTFVEVGPGTTLSKFVAKTLGEEVKIYSVNSLEGLQQCREGLEA